MTTVYINCPKCSEKIPNQLLAQHYKICNGQQSYMSPKNQTSEAIQKPGFPDTNNLRQQLQEMKNRKARIGQQGGVPGGYRPPKLYFNAPDDQNDVSEGEQLYTRPIKPNNNEVNQDNDEEALYARRSPQSKTSNLMNQVRAELSKQTEQLYQDPQELLRKQEQLYNQQKPKQVQQSQQADAITDNMERVQCEYCERFFTADRIEKHKNVCQQRPNNQKKRKQFDSAGQRLDTENPEEKSLMHRVSVPRPKNIYDTVGRIHSNVNRLVAPDPVQAFGEGTLNFKAEYDDGIVVSKGNDTPEVQNPQSDQQTNVKQPENVNYIQPQETNQKQEEEKQEGRRKHKSSSGRKKHHSSKNGKEQELDFLKTQLMQLMQQNQQQQPVFQPQMTQQQPYMIQQVSNPYMQPQQPMMMQPPGMLAKFCVNCGMQYLDQARFCGYCGTPRAQLK